MKKLVLQITALCIAAISPTLMSTSTCGGIVRAVAIDGNVALGGANGSNGTNWEINEENPSVDGVIFCYTWDDNNLYVGWKGGQKTEQHILFIDTDPMSPPNGGTGSTTGPAYGCQTPTMSFTANFFVNIQSNYNEYRNWNGADWGSGMAGELTVQSSSSNQDIEAVIPWTKITGGRPSAIYLLSFCNAPCNACGTNKGFIYGATPQNNGNTAGCSSNPNFITGFSASITCGQAPNGNPTVLPVELLDFQGIKNGEAADLAWLTGAAHDLARFEIERSSDGKTWESIQQIPARTQGDRFQKKYAWSDVRPNRGDNFYRLRMVDLDGSFAYSKSVLVKFSADRLLRFAPNPVYSGSVKVFFEQSGHNLLSVYDVHSRLVMQREMEAEAGTWQELHVNDLQRGTYFVQVNHTECLILIKQ